MSSLLEKLKEYAGSDFYPMHMPGHKRRMAVMPDPVSIDITEIDGFDNLHHAGGILLEAQQNAAALYGSDETCFLVNGSTCGILTAIGAAAGFGDRILMARNSHRSAYHAVYLNHLKPKYLIPQEPAFEASGAGGRIRPEDVERQLQENPDIHTVFITSPTYDGVVSDVRAIARAAHRHHAVLIVDEAHGAHFGMHPLFPDSSVHLGADLVIHSLHKTLPSLTQTALLHVNGDRVDRNKIRRLLDVYETSSPSYVLMASMDQCVRLLQQKGPELFEAYAGMLSRFDSLTGNLRVLKRIKTDDPSKIIIACPGGEMSGPQMAASLRKRFHIEPEMVTPEYVLCLSGIGDDEEGLVRLEEAMADIDEELFIHKQFRTADITGDDPATFTSGEAGLQENLAAEGKGSAGIGTKMQNARRASTAAPTSGLPENRLPECVMEISEAWDLPREKTEHTPLSSCAGRVSCEFAYLYPPGIPLVTPGERIPEKLPEYFRYCLEQGFEIQGLEDYSMKTIRTLRTANP